MFQAKDEMMQEYIETFSIFGCAKNVLTWTGESRCWCRDGSIVENGWVLVVEV